MLVGMIFRVAAIMATLLACFDKPRPTEEEQQQKRFVLPKHNGAWLAKIWREQRFTKKPKILANPRSIGNFILGEHGGPRMRYSTQQKENKPL